MLTSGKTAVMMSLLLATVAAYADEPAKPAAASLSDVLDASGITVTGYADATYSYGDHSAALLPDDTSSVNTFGLNQAALTISKLPSSGFGALVNLVDGTEAGTGLYAPSYSYAGNINSSTNLDVLQAYVQYASGKLTVMAGKFVTLAGAEVAAPTGNANVSRSLLFWYSEPINHTGVRVVTRPPTRPASPLAPTTAGTPKPATGRARRWNWASAWLLRSPLRWPAPPTTATQTSQRASARRPWPTSWPPGPSVPR